MQINEKNYTYTFIRNDLPIEQQIVQAAHSAYEAGRDHNISTIPSHLVLLEAKSETALEKIANKLTEAGIKFSMFYEPDYNRGYTSITTEPLLHNDARRKLFSKFSLYKYRPHAAFSMKDEIFSEN